MDGLLVVDKPVGPTSHDVVARVRRLLRERRVGHTGTLDPMAGGVLVLLVGRATRLARFLGGVVKSYEAVVRLGIETDSYDMTGSPVGVVHHGPYPMRDEVDRALNAFRSTFLQQPPLFSAKKISGRRSYEAARAERAARHHSPVLAEPHSVALGDSAPPARTRPLSALPDPVSVTAHSIDLVSVDGDLVTLRVDCSAGFYVRSLAHDLGERLDIGAHVAALRRTRNGQFTLDDAAELAVLERNPDVARVRLIPLARVLPELTPVVLTPEGVRRAIHGRDLGPGDTEKWVGRIFDASLGENPPDPFFVRLLDSDGDLVGIAEPGGAPGLLHPSVVLK